VTGTLTDDHTVTLDEALPLTPMMECGVKPLREGNADLLKDFDDYFEGAVAVPEARSVCCVHD
jgi:hypothetical protein